MNTNGRINLKNLKAEIIRSSRKTLSIEVKKDGSLMIRAPYHMTKSAIEAFLQEKEGWIMKQVQRVEDRKALLEEVEPLTTEEVQRLADLALKVIPVKVRHYAGIMKVTYGTITIRNQKTGWGSCSSKRNLNFNCLLMLAPDEVVDYVVVHELCHLLEMNHSKEFWDHVEKVMPDYRKHRQWLKDHGNELMIRMFPEG